MLKPSDIVHVGGKLTASSVLAAYHQGVFPWFSHDGSDVLWWSPDPRYVLDVDEVHRGRTVRKTLKKLTFTIDAEFDRVIQECADKRYAAKSPEGTDRTDTWITPRMLKVYRTLYREGFAHSVEAWKDGELVGGLYGLCLGNVFFGESMFAHMPNASKAALVFLCDKLTEAGVVRIDCQMETPLMKYMGAKFISRQKFRDGLLLGLLTKPTLRGKWSIDGLPDAE